MTGGHQICDAEHFGATSNTYFGAARNVFARIVRRDDDNDDVVDDDDFADGDASSSRSEMSASRGSRSPPSIENDGGKSDIDAPENCVDIVVVDFFVVVVAASWQGFGNGDGDGDDAPGDTKRCTSFSPVSLLCCNGASGGDDGGGGDALMSSISLRTNASSGCRCKSFYNYIVTVAWESKVRLAWT
jgi:hypothetical protein